MSAFVIITVNESLTIKAFVFTFGSAFFIFANFEIFPPHTGEPRNRRVDDK